MLAHQLFANQLLGLGFLVQSTEVEVGVAELFSAGHGERARIRKLLLHQMGDQRDFVLTSLLAGFRGHVGLDKAFLHNTPC